MTTTTTFGTWNNRVQDGELTVEQSVYVALGDYADDYDLDAVAADYRAAINDALPSSVSLCGDEFIGPYYAEDRDFDGYPTDEDDRLDIKAIVEGIDFWAIAAEHDTTA
ncbi:hypothetical protein OG589_14440 [Sphaerisporangium sp. NBC_01403]|uniref:hypothetical protein n=1 Tax=Sphaerisporangium sp. NBC_01403 TaxID=2903599 RepID=UPI00324C6703